MVTAAFDPLNYRPRETVDFHDSERSGRIYVAGATTHAAGGLKPHPPPHAHEPQPLKAPHLLTTLLERQAVQASCGWRHSAIVLDDGQLYVTGDNEYGQCGLGGSGSGSEVDGVVDVSDDGGGSPPPRMLRVPTLVPGLGSVRVTQVSCGRSHTAFVCSEGELYTTGLNLYGQLGLGSLRSRSTPARVKALGGVAAYVSCGDLHTLVLRADGKALSCGFNDAGRLGRALPDASASCAETLQPLPLHAAAAASSEGGVGVVALAAGGAHSAIVCADGSVYTCGRGECGQLGHGSASPELMPRRVSALRPHKVRRAALGAQHSLFLTHTGVPFACGCGGFGRLGLGDREASLVPLEVGGPGGGPLSGLVVVQVSAGNAHSSFVTGDGQVFLCGDDGKGALGLGGGKASVLLPTAPPKFARAEGLARVGGGAAAAKGLGGRGGGGQGGGQGGGKFLRKGEGKNIVQSQGREADGRARARAEAAAEAEEEAEEERRLTLLRGDGADGGGGGPPPVRVLGASCGGEHTMFLLRAVVDPRVDYREDQLELAASVIGALFRGNHVRAMDKAVERRRRPKEERGFSHAARVNAAEVIQAAGRMHLAVRQRERQEQLAQMRALRDAADEEGNNWARAQRQFQNAQMGNAFSGMGDPRRANLTKASW